MQVHAKQTKAYKAAGQRGSQRLAARRVPRGGQGATQSKGHANAVIYATLTALQHSPVAGTRYALEAFVACNVQCKDWAKWQTGGAVAVVAGNGVSDAHSLACSDPQQEPRTPGSDSGFADCQATLD